ncbi:hypothetical protein AB204_20770 [Xenorhabdus khoisanae]|uniref:Uncharacterized protein n=1 Tax=Xenorhabdus khoisanae TaxID=880157 RepID=A0A0J5FMN2_9GAMM|nr:hypothetical protein AB204_20770 [Xenorhabdus khoisanae]
MAKEGLDYISFFIPPDIFRIKELIFQVYPPSIKLHFYPSPLQIFYLLILHHKKFTFLVVTNMVSLANIMTRLNILRHEKHIE